MPTNVLTDAAIKALKPQETGDYKIADGEGLNLLVRQSGSRLWRLSYRFGGKQKTLALGSYPDIGLASARAKRALARDLLRKGVDPAQQRKADRIPVIPDQNRTFDAVTFQWFEARKAGWTASHGQRVWNRVKQDLSSAFGSRDIADVGASDLLSALRKIEARGAVETAHRTRKYAEDIFAFAKACHLADGNPAVELSRALATPTPTVHHPALRASDFPDFLAKLNLYEGDPLTRDAIKLVLLTFVRTSELRFARWEEFEGLDGDEPTWRIPAARMKMRNPHLVPLSFPATSLLTAIKGSVDGRGHLFPGASKAGVISQNTLIYALYRLGYHSRATIHGFRRSASTILNENEFNRDWIERQLAHVESNNVRAAYNAAEWMPQRRKMMTWWGEYLVRSGMRVD